MTRDRTIILLDLVNDYNNFYRDSNSHASLQVYDYATDINIYHYDNPEDGAKAHCYSTCVEDCLSHGVKFVDDPDLKQAEEHLRRLLNA